VVTSWHGTDDERIASATVLSWCDGSRSSRLVIALSDSDPDPAARRAGVARQALAIADALGSASLRRAALERIGEGKPPTHLSLATRTLTVDGRRVHTTRREFEILAALALNRRPMTHDGLVNRIWPHVDGDRGRTCLRVLAHRLRARAGRRDIVVADRELWSLGFDVTVDFWEWQQRLRQAAAVPATPELRDQLTDAYDQLLLAVKDAPTRSEVDAELERAAQDLLRSVAAFLVEEALVAGDFGRVLAIARAVLPIDPYAEIWHESIVRAHRRTGNDRAALDHLTRYAELLQTELGVTFPRDLMTVV
jgi:DNA-binding SARP family transcriptional activator